MMRKSSIFTRKAPHKPAGHHRFLLMVMLCLWFFTVSSSFAATWYVNDTGSGNGTSWASPYPTIQDAIVAAASGDEIWVKEGTYLTAEEITINKAIVLYGGFPDAIASPAFGDRNPGTYTTTIDGQDFTTVSHCLHLVGGGITVDGFTITGGNHSTYSSPPQYLGGGGIAMRKSHNNTIRNCIITGNQSNNSGGGMAIWESAGTSIEGCRFSGNTVTGSYGGGALTIRNVSGTTTITGCTFSNNSCAGGGGAIYHFSDYDDSVTISDSSFTSNRTTTAYGGALAMAGGSTISNCSFTGNSATNTTNGSGGAIYATDDYRGTIENCTFDGNTANDKYSNRGGGAILFSAGVGPVAVQKSSFSNNSCVGHGGAISIFRADITLSECTFLKNRVRNYDASGGALSNYGASPRIENCLFAGNGSHGTGGAMANLLDTMSSPDLPSSPEIYNCTFTENFAKNQGGAITNESANPVITNSILWANQSLYTNYNEMYNSGSSPVVSYTDIAGGYGGDSNLNDNPLFVTSGTYNYNMANTIDDDTWTQGDYHLQASSPCLDAGTDADMPAVDLEGLSRPYAFHDMGAYEGRFDYFRLTVHTAGQGTVTLDPPQSEDGYVTGRTVTLQAVPNPSYPGWSFGEWSGAVSGSANSAILVMDGDRSVTGTFILTNSGDIDGSNTINLTDAVRAFQISTDTTSGFTAFKEADVSGDDKIGLEEAIYLLQTIAELRNED